MSVLVDGDAYYRAFASAAKKAQRSILMIGWDMNSRVELVRPNPNDGMPYQLGAFLDALCRRNDKLHIHVLEWDFSLVFALERELLPRYHLGTRRHRRVHFELDDQHAAGGSHHQKIVVIDDQVAFVGGLDFAEMRWDTPEHAHHEARRVSHDGHHYGAFHDVQTVVAGPVARALGDLARERWQRATGRTIEPCRVESDPWPDAVTPEIAGIEVAIARTEAAHDEREGVREIEQLHLDAIASAERSIYIESQYLTSRTITEALIKKLMASDGPEVVMVLPQIASGWLEENTMSILRGRVLELLKEADLYGRLRIVCPVVADTAVNVHAKVMVVDDSLVRIGSANLSNRSMGLDSECDLVWEGDTPASCAHVVSVRQRLIAEHMAVPRDVYAEAEGRLGLIGAIDAVKHGQRFLRALEPRDALLKTEILPAEKLVDPTSPLDVDLILDTLVPDDIRPSRAPLWRSIAVVLVMLGLAAAWRFTPLHQFVDPRRVAEIAAPIRDEPLAWVIAVGGYIVAGLLSFPLMLLVLQSGLIFGAARGIPIAIVGALLSGSLMFWIGRLVGRSTLQKLSGRRLKHVIQRMRRSGVVAVIIVRLVPIAPYSVINVIAGATGLRFSRFFLGSAVGLLPGIIGISLFGSSLFEALASRDPWALATAIAVAGIIVSFGVWVRRRLDRRVVRRDIAPKPRTAAAES